MSSEKSINYLSKDIKKLAQKNFNGLKTCCKNSHFYPSQAPTLTVSLICDSFMS